MSDQSADGDIPEPGDDGYDEWLEGLVGCENCGGTEYHREELRFGRMEGSLVEVCSECGFPYLHNESTYGGGHDKRQ